jgi:hypothetical protein
MKLITSKQAMKNCIFLQKYKETEDGHMAGRNT